MLPFYSGELAARRLLIYDEQHGSQHPLNAVEIHNETAGALDGGAMTVYDGGGYAGEAIMDTLKAGDKRLVSYAVDLGARITSKFHSESKTLRELHANDGMLLYRTLHRNRKTFLIRNVDPKAKTLWIEHRPSGRLRARERAARRAHGGLVAFRGPARSGFDTGIRADRGAHRNDEHRGCPTWTMTSCATTWRTSSSTPRGGRS